MASDTVELSVHTRLAEDEIHVEAAGEPVPASAEENSTCQLFTVEDEITSEDESCESPVRFQATPQTLRLAPTRPLPQRLRLDPTRTTATLQLLEIRLLGTDGGDPVTRLNATNGFEGLTEGPDVVRLEHHGTHVLYCLGEDPQLFLEPFLWGQTPLAAIEVDLACARAGIDTRFVRAALQDLTARVGGLLATRAEQSADADALRAELARLHEESTAREANLQIEIDDLRKETESLRAENATRGAHLESAVQDLRNEAASFRQANGSREAAREAELASVREARDALQQELQALTQQTASLQTEKTWLSQALEQSRSEAKRLYEQFGSVSQLLEIELQRDREESAARERASLQHSQVLRQTANQIAGAMKKSEDRLLQRINPLIAAEGRRSRFMDTVLFPLRGLRAAARAVRHPVRTGKLWTAARAIRKSGYFDEAYYCRENPEVRFLGFDPLMHFLEYGWREGRQPSEHFDVRFYLTAYADVRKSDECPLWHYLRHGQHENRLALPPGSAAAVEAPNRGAYLASFGEDHYGAWYTLHMQMHPAEERLYCQDMERFPRRPKVSILMPVYNTPGDLLRNAIDSVREQIYPDWELCIADDASSKAHIQPILDEYAELDDRIRICYRERNGHIAEASNSALELATGEYVAFLDHDDALTPDALYWQVKYLLAYPQTRLVYSDEDKLTLTGNLHSPHFKPDWNPDYFYSVNYLCHFTVMEADLARKTGGFRDTFNGAQDYDFFLRCIAQLQSDEIGHVPRILYHWRQAIGSTAATGDNKNYAREAGIKALEDHFRQTGVDATVENGPDSVVYQVRRIPPSPHPLVTIIIPTRNGAEYLERCVESIFARTEYENFEILVVDNESDEAATRELLDALRKRPRCEVLEAPGEFNFSAINNAAVEHARGEMVCLLNNDTEVISPEWLTDMVGHCARSEVGAVGAKLLYPDDTIQHAGVGLGLGGVAGHMHKYYPADSAGYFGRLVATYDFSAVTAACLLARKEVYEEVGGLDETIFAVAFNDIDFCLRLRKAGYWNVYVPTAKLYHYESKSRGLEDSPQKQARFSAEVRLMKARWGASVLEQDGAYNPNLTLDSEDLHIAREPHSGWRRALQKAFDQAIAAAGQAKKPQRAASASEPSPSSPT